MADSPNEQMNFMKVIGVIKHRVSKWKGSLRSIGICEISKFEI